MNDKPYQWGHEHFCQPDATDLYNNEPRRLEEVGYPVELDAPPEPETFCSVCLQWFTAKVPEGLDSQPPKTKETNE